VHKHTRGNFTITPVHTSCKNFVSTSTWYYTWVHCAGALCCVNTAIFFAANNKGIVARPVYSRYLALGNFFFENKIAATRALFPNIPEI
jgi:hypothetical protein